MNTAIFEMGYKLEHKSIYSLVSIYTKYIIARFFIKSFLFFVLRFSFFQKAIYRWATGQVNELYLLLKGFGDVVREYPIHLIESEHRYIIKILPVYERLDMILKKLSVKYPEILSFSNSHSLLLNELLSLEATLELLSDATSARNIVEAEEDLRKGENFEEWIPSQV
jgi:hypothetical protein